MNELPRFDVYGSALERKRLPSRLGRKVAICFVVALILIVMTGWFGFLGWGLVEVLQRIVAIIKSL
jgi:hypothetical protein